MAWPERAPSSAASAFRMTTNAGWVQAPSARTTRPSTPLVSRRGRFREWRGSTLAAGWEHLGGNGVVALQTPLATLHRHNGWADIFTVTPANGLRDLHVRFLQELPDLGPAKNPKLDVRFHDFAAARGGA